MDPSWASTIRLTHSAPDSSANDRTMISGHRSKQLPPNPTLVQQVTFERATAGGRHNTNRKDDSNVN